MTLQIEIYLVYDITYFIPFTHHLNIPMDAEMCKKEKKKKLEKNSLRYLLL